MAPTKLDSLPGEILLQIIARVPFIETNIQPLLLTNRRINALVTQNHRQLLVSAVEAQYPLALLVEPWMPFRGEHLVTIKSRLTWLRLSTDKICRYTEMLQEIRQLMSIKRVPFGPAFGAQGWKTNLQIALYALAWPSEHQISVDSGLADPEMPEYYAKVFDGLPRYAILAVRHCTLIILEIMKFLNQSYEGLIDEHRQNVMASMQYSDATLLDAIEYKKIHGILLYFFEVIWSYRWQGEQRREYDAWHQLGRIIGKLSDHIQPHFPAHIAIRSSVDARIWDILDDWDNFARRDPEAVAALQMEGEQQDLKAVRALVERFCY